MNRCVSLLALSALAAAAKAHVLIEDFTVGAFSVELTGSQSHSSQQTGLDQNHSAFGKRGWFLDIGGNPENETLRLDVGNHEQKLSTPSNRLTWRMDLGLGVSGDVLIDLSKETSIYVDLYTVPEDLFADHWSMSVTDVNAVSTSNDGWLLRARKGIEFEIESFSRPIDWSRVRSIEFYENFDSGLSPLTYSVTQIYAVPEPATAAMGMFALGLVLKRPRAKRFHGS